MPAGEILIDVLQLSSSDPVAHSTGIFDVFHQQMQASVSRFNQFLAEDARKLVCQKVHTVLLVCGREKVQIPLHRVRNLLRMHGRNNEMSGFRSLQRRQRSLVIPDLTDKNDIRRLTKRTPQPDRKSAGVTSDLSLGEMTAIAGELILDGILDRHYMSH